MTHTYRKSVREKGTSKRGQGQEDWREEEREREREREKGRKDILIEEALKIIIFIRFELQWTVIDSSPLSLSC